MTNITLAQQIEAQEGFVRTCDLGRLNMGNAILQSLKELQSLNGMNKQVKMNIQLIAQVGNNGELLYLPNAKDLVSTGERLCKIPHIELPAAVFFIKGLS